MGLCRRRDQLPPVRSSPGRPTDPCPWRCRAARFLLCLVYERSGSIYPCIALHALNNAIVSAAEFDRVSGIALLMGAGMLAFCLIGSLLTRVKPEPQVKMVA